MKHIRFAAGAMLLLACSLCTSAQIITTYAGNSSISPAWSGDGGPATAAAMHLVYSVAVDNGGNLYIGEANKVIRKVTPAGIITTVAGNGTLGYTGDGGPATAASIGWPAYIAVDGMGNIYIAQSDYSVIRKVAPSGIITTFAGNGTPGYSGDGGPATAAAIGLASGLATDNLGNVYFTDYAGSVRKVDVTGIITRVAGNGTLGYSGDGGPATAAQLYGPAGLTVSGTDLYIADEGNHVIRKVNAAGIITTVAGDGATATTGTMGGTYHGDGGPAIAAGLNGPIGVAVNSATGDMFISDRNNHRIRKVDAAGVITTYAGNGTGGYSGDGGPANSVFTSIYWQWGIALDAAGRLYIADELNYVVRRIETTSNIPPSPGESGTTFTCEGSPVPVDTMLAAMDPDAGQTESWTLVSGPYHGILAGAPTTSPTTGSWVFPSGLVYTPDAGFHGLDTFTVEICDGYNCVVTTRYVYVDTAVGAGAVTGATTLCIGDTIALSATVPGGAWISSNANASVSGGAVAGINEGTADIYYIINSNCGADTVIHTVNVLGSGDCETSVGNMTAGAGAMKIMPNPNTGSFTIALPENSCTIVIADIMGREVLRAANKRNKAHVTSLLPGTYVVTVYAGEHTERQLVQVY